MSQGYGLSIYGLSYYGYSQSEDYSIDPFTAQQTDYGKITLHWFSPNTTAWKYLQLVRSNSGYPTTPQDGELLLNITAQSMIRSYDDIDTIEGNIYYYAMFIAIDAPAYGSGITYPENFQVLYNGQYWASLQNGNIGHTPAVSSAYWQSVSFIPTWYPAGYVASMALANQGYGTRLYSRTPQPYKINTSDTFSDVSVDNPSLQRYLNVFGFGLDLLKGSYDSFLSLNDPAKLSASNLDILAQQFGLNTDYLSTPSQRRQRLANVSVNYQIKGQTNSIHNLIAELSGWDSEITYDSNIMVSADQTAFVHPMYVTWSANTLYFSGQKVQYNNYNYVCATTQAYGASQGPTGTSSSNTWWTVSSQFIDTGTAVVQGTFTQSTWNVTSSSVAAIVNGVMVGVPHPRISGINNWNAMASQQTSNFNNFAGYDLNSIADLYVTAWSNSVNYLTGRYVTYTDGYTYVALKPSGPASVYGTYKTPGLHNDFWEAVYYVSGDFPSRFTDTAVIPNIPTWDSSVVYYSGTIVEFNGNVYRCALDNVKQTPSLGYYSTVYWTFLYSLQNGYNFGIYATRFNNAALSGAYSSIIPKVYSAQGLLLNNYASTLSGYPVAENAYSTRFAVDYKDLQGTAEAGIYLGVNNALITGGGPGWTAVPTTANLWRSSYGMASVNPSAFTSSSFTALLLQQVPTYGSDTVQQGRYCVTFASDYTDSGHLTHGLIFYYKDSSNFYYITRLHLRKVVSGTDTIIASWPRLQTGDRVLVDVSASDIHVYKYARTGDGSLNIIATALGSAPPATSSTIYTGLLHKYNASGDL